ncbi:MAG: DUF2520 domain-containing protein [Herminiimonas sp.]|nr:DUF2520 domain-containing protein [Herminiimonas sp.]
MMRPPARSLSIIGAGRVATALGRVLTRRASIQVRDVLARSVARAQAAVDFIGAGTPVVAFTDLRAADVYLLAVPDDHIAGCCAQLVASGVIGAGAIVFHCSGALGADVLAPARDAGAAVASLHPVRSFADPAAVADDFAGTCCGIEGDSAATAVLRPLFEAVGARVIPIDATHKTLYHAAAVFASNYVVTLIDVAMQVYGQAGVAPAVALEMIAPLLRESAENAFRLGPEAALTGPIARGDASTVMRQQAALAARHPAHAVLYAQLAEATAALALRKV